jgi:outer membrane biosynthesis protein TonB
MFLQQLQKNGRLARKRNFIVFAFFLLAISTFLESCVFLVSVKTKTFLLSSWAVSKDLSLLQKHEIEAYINEPHKKSGDLLQGYKIALNPSEWEAGLGTKQEAKEEEAADEEVDQLDEADDDNDDDEPKKAKTGKKRKRESETKPKKKKEPKKSAGAEAKEKKTPAKKKTIGKKNGTRSKETIESEDDGEGEEDAAAESSKKTGPVSKRARKGTAEDDLGKFLSIILTCSIDIEY